MHDLKWDRRFLRIAREAATWSKDPSTKVGATIVWPDRTFVCGYNGFPRGMKDDPALLGDRAAKNIRTLHAEENAILNASGGTEGTTVYVTHPPCIHCALVIIQAGIRRVVYIQPGEDFLSRWGDQFNTAQEFFWDVGINTLGISDIDDVG